MNQLELTSQIQDVRLCSVKPTTIQTNQNICMIAADGNTTCTQVSEKNQYIDGSSVILASRAQVMPYSCKKW